MFVMNLHLAICWI